MLAPMLTNIPAKPLQVAPGANTKLPNDHAESKDFGRILKQQDSQQLREKESTNSDTNESVKDYPHERIDDGSEQVSHSSEHISSDSAGIAGVKNVETNVVSENPLAAIIESNINYSEGTVLEADAVSPWAFWVQYIQESAPAVENTLNYRVEENPDIVPISTDIQQELPNHVILPVIAASSGGINAALPPDEISLLLKAQKTSSSLNIVTGEASFFAKDFPGIEISEVAPVALVQEHNGISQLLQPSLPTATFTFKGVMDSASAQSQALPIVDTIATDFPTGETVPNLISAADSKWIGQTENASNAVGISPVENKTFFQLRFNQQTLAPDLAEKTGWLIEHKLDTAHIQLDPPELGPITVKIHTHQEQVSVTFVVNNAQVRDAMDQTMQRLKDLLQEQGIMLAHSDVNSQRQHRDNQSPEDSSGAHMSEADNEDDMLTSAMPEITQGVDHFV